MGLLLDFWTRNPLPPYPPQSNFPHFHAVLGKIWPHNRSAPPSDCDILDPPLPNNGTLSFYECRLSVGDTQTLPAVIKFI